MIDNGRGIEPAHAQRVFEPFYSTKFTGRGLGALAAGSARFDLDVLRR